MSRFKPMSIAVEERAWIFVSGDDPYYPEHGAAGMYAEICDYI